jgi:hypothetical protein
MPTPDARSRLALMQAQLVRGLVGHGTLPADFDVVRLEAASEALATKRARAVVQAWPGLAQALGESFAELFAGYAGPEGIPHRGGPLADGRAFVRYLSKVGSLPDAGRLQALWVDLHYRSCRDGLRPRRLPAIALVFLGDSGRLLLGIQLPGIVRYLNVPFWRAGPRTNPAKRIDAQLAASGRIAHDKAGPLAGR